MEILVEDINVDILVDSLLAIVWKTCEDIFGAQKTPGATSVEIAKNFHEIKNEISSISNLLDE